MPFFKDRAQRKFWKEAAERGDVNIVIRRPEAHARIQAQNDLEEELSPGYKARKEEEERMKWLNLEIELREKYANEEKDALERQLRESREAAGRRLTLVPEAPRRHELEAPSSNGYGQVASQTYRDDRPCPLHSEHGTQRYENPREVPNRPHNQTDGPMQHQRYDHSQPYASEYGDYVEESRSRAGTHHYSTQHELEGELPAAHLSSVTRGGPYELSERQDTQGYDPSSAYGNWI